MESERATPYFPTGEAKRDKRERERERRSVSSLIGPFVSELVARSIIASFN